MPLILESYNADTETILLSRARDNLSAGTSLVEIVEDEKQVFLKIRVGSNDQDTIHKAVIRWSYAEHRYITPGKQRSKKGLDMVDAYHEICDALKGMKSPVSYRKTEILSNEGYPVDSAVLQAILDAAKKEVFANICLAGCTSSYATVSYDEKHNPISGLVYKRVNVEFNKKPQAL